MQAYCGKYERELFQDIASHKSTSYLELLGAIMQDNTPAAKPEKKHFVTKLILSWPTFAQDMTEEERDIMKQHAAYWKDIADKGIALVYGPVLYPKSVYGLGIIEVENEDEARSFAADDPRLNPGLIG
jgi:uncharacterized protein YciI